MSDSGADEDDKERRKVRIRRQKPKARSWNRFSVPVCQGGSFLQGR